VTSNRRTTGDIRGRSVQCCRHHDFPSQPALLQSQPIETVQLVERAAALEVRPK
jgi:hypothetical protein